MIISNGLILAALTGAAMTISGAVHAEVGVAYVGIEAGSSGADFKSTANVYSSTLASPVTSSTDRNSVATRLFAGYQFNKNFAVETGLGGVGRFASTQRSGADAVKNQLTVGGFTLDAIGSLPLTEHWSVYSGVGIGYMQVESKAILGGAAKLTTGESSTRTERNSVFHARVGVGYAIDEQWAVRFDVDGYKGIGTTKGTSATGRADANSVTFGVSYRF